MTARLDSSLTSQPGRSSDSGAARAGPGALSRDTANAGAASAYRSVFFIVKLPVSVVPELLPAEFGDSCTGCPYRRPRRPTGSR